MKTRLARYFSLLALVFASLSLTAAGTPLAPHTLAPTTNYAFRPLSAYAGGRFLTIWRESMGFIGAPIMGAFSDATGARLSPRSFPLDIPPVAHSFAYHLVGTGDSFTLVWKDGDGRTWLADVDLEGQVTNRRTVALPDSIDTRIAWNGTHFLAVLQLPSSRNVAVTMFDRDGRIVLPPAQFPGETHGAGIAVAGGRFIVLTSGSAALMAQEVTPRGIGAAKRVDVPADAAHANHYPSLVLATAAGNGDVLVVWVASASANVRQLRSAIVRADGTVAPLTVLAHDSASPIEVVRSGDGYMLAFERDGELYRMRLDAAGAPIGEPELVLSGFQGGAAAAGDGTILVAFNTVPNALADIATLALPAAGPPRTEIVSISPSRQLQPILSAGESVIATWTELVGDAPVVRAVSVGDDGQPGVPVNVASGVLAAREAPWNQARQFGEESLHLIVYRHEGRLLATRVTPDATKVDATPIVLATLVSDWSAEAAVVWVEHRWLVVWTDSGSLHSLTVSRDGVPSDARTLDVHPPIEEGFLRLLGSPELAYDGQVVLLVWAESHWPRNRTPMDPAPPVKAWATRLTETGAPSDPQPLDLDLRGPHLSVASSGHDFLVVAGQHARAVDGDGALRVTAARELFGWRASSDVTWDRDHYSVALRYYGEPTRWYLAVLSLGRDAAPRATARATATLPPFVDLPPSIAAGGWGALVGVQEGTAADGVSATVYGLADLGFMPAPPEPPRHVQVHQLSSWNFEVTWDAPAEGDPDAYVVEQLLGQTWIAVASVTGDVRRAHVSSYFRVPVVRVRSFTVAGPSEPAEPGGGRPKRRSIR